MEMRLERYGITPIFRIQSGHTEDMPSPHAFEDELRRALGHLYDPVYLRKSPLLGLLGLQEARNPPEALRNALQGAIESMQPDPDSPVTAKTARIYQILFQRYVQQFTQGDVAHQLDISPRHLRREQGFAIQALAERLCVEFGLPETIDAVLLEQFDANLAPDDVEGVEQEMSWLEDSFGDQVTQVEATIREAQQLAERVALKHGAELVTTCTAHLPPLNVARTVLRQIVLGLVTTAIHSTPGGTVSLAARAEQGEVQIRVVATTDSRGERHPPERDGLDMVARLAELFDGRLVVSKAENPFVAQVTFPSAEQIIALAVEDNVDTLALWERYLQGTPFCLHGVRDPEQVIPKAAELHPKLIILDVMMPEVDGWEILGQLRNHPATSTIPVIVCTVLPQEELALSLGANGFMRKPVTRQAFRASLARQIVAAGSVSTPRESAQGRAPIDHPDGLPPASC